MKYCPKCQNKGFTPSEGFSKPLIHKGKENHKKFSIRYWACVNCGARFKTIEKLLQYLDEGKDLFAEEKERS